MNAIERATRVLNSTTARLAGTDAEYIRAGRVVCCPRVVAAAVSEDVLAEESFETRGRAQDWIVKVEALAVSGVPFEPAAGDRIRVRRAGKPWTYEVAELGDHAAEPADAYGVAWRIHSKLVASG